MVDALASAGDEGRGKLRKASVSCKRASIRRCPNGVTRRGKPSSARGESIATCGQRGQLKHLSSPRNRKQHAISPVAASERETAQTDCVSSLCALRSRGCGVGCSGGTAPDGSYKPRF